MESDLEAEEIILGAIGPSVRKSTVFDREPMRIPNTLRRPLALTLLLILIPSCGGRKDPFDAETIRGDMEDRSLHRLYEEARERPWSPPEDGLLTEEHIAGFLKVAPLAQRIVEVAGERIDAEVEIAQASDDHMTRAGAAFAAIGSMRNAATAHLRAALMLDLNPNQQIWVLDQIVGARWNLGELRRFDSAVTEAEQTRDSETNPLLREQNEAALAAAREARRSWQQSMGDARLANAWMVDKHAEELGRFVPAVTPHKRR